ncbi:TonB-dependent receptor [Achromobacter sp. Root83]|uniref:TonB-dependent copper receptor n=1 Tax=Achromobacter sp. Root83 TaxID=1736602 RepID=UPI00070DEF76|nr:TonB-dependent copper receptor [Achromobacter sp. Root83]KRC80561.1 TonB-dependent receptor [Achromobacter sp. Root83]
MSKKHEFLRMTCLAAAMAASFPAWAQAADGVSTLDPVVIVGVAPSAPLTFTTDPKLPRQPLPASDGTDYLKTIPGFSAIRNGGTNGDPVLRGMFGSRLNILTNGTSMPGACPARMDAPSSYISPENFDELTVIKGPQTVLWGPGASAGTIRFDRDTPRFTGDGVRFDGSLVGGSFGRNDQTADLTVGNEKVYTRVTANHSHSQDYKDGNGDTVPSRWDKWNADVTLGFTPDADTLYELTAGTGDGEARYAGRSMDGSRFKRESFGVRFEKRNIGTVLNKVQAQLYYNYADHVMDNYTLRAPDPMSAMPMAMAADVDRATWGGRFASTWDLSQDVSLDAGLDFQQSRHRSRSGTDSMPYRSQAWVKDADFSNTGLFGEITWRAAPDSRVIGGARVDWSSAKDFRQTAGGMMMPMPNPTAGERRRDTLPSGFLRYEKDLAALPATVYIGLGHVERFPDYWELFSPDSGPAGSVNAFEGVKPEKTTQLDFGAQYKTETLDAWFSGYAGYVDDFILFNYQSGGMMGPSSQATNVDARIFGGELGASYAVTPEWKLGATLAYAWGQNRSDGRALPQMPPLEAKLSATYDDGTWSAGALWRIVAPQKRYALNEGNVVGKDFGPSAGFGVFSINGGYAVNKQVRLSLGVDNLFNKTYSEHLNLAGNAGFGYAANTGVNEPGRSVWARVSVRY